MIHSWSTVSPVSLRDRRWGAVASGQVWSTASSAKIARLPQTAAPRRRKSCAAASAREICGKGIGRQRRSLEQHKVRSGPNDTVEAVYRHEESVLPVVYQSATEAGCLELGHALVLARQKFGDDGLRGTGE